MLHLTCPKADVGSFVFIMPPDLKHKVGIKQKWAFDLCCILTSEPAEVLLALIILQAEREEINKSTK